MSTRPALLDVLRARAMLHQHSDGLAEHLARGPVVAYCGFDPTAPSLHVGNLVPAMGLLRIAEAGHRVIALVGGGTALIGDPSGKSTERPLLSQDDVAANAAAIGAQLRRVLGDRVTMADNAEWLRPLGLVEFLRDIGKHFPVNQMLAKDTVKSRLETGISFTEFSYMLLQAYDYLQLHVRHGVTLQIGGSDQWGNITAGTELIRRSAGGDAHAMTFPLLTMAGGRKFGKTEGGAVWLDSERTSPYEFYQFWINTDDADVGRLLRIFTMLPDDAIERLERDHAAAPQARAAQRALALEVTTRVHSAADANRARAASDIVFDKHADPTRIDDSVYAMLAANVPSVRRTADALGVAEVLEAAFEVSRSQARKLVAQGGVSANGLKLTPDAASLDVATAVRGRWFLLRKGGRDIAVVEVVPPS
jgi:tyrosyl-tRNA synthetase